jgi:hypothetical protein
MPSRKKAKGKARKAAKEAKAKQEESRAAGEVAANQQHVQEESVEDMMERLRISATSPKLCRHGCPPLSDGEEKIFGDFVNAYLAALSLQGNAGLQAFSAAHRAPMEEYPDVHSSKLDTVISMLLATGTQRILDEHNDIAQRYAMLACYFEDYMAVFLHKTRAVPNLTKAYEWHGADDHTLISYYRKRISCSCLDEKYKEVKSVKKMGRCYNQNCSHPDGRVERNKMLSCTRCGEANYCSVGCQRAHWKEHREECNEAVNAKEFFNSSQT